MNRSITAEYFYNGGAGVMRLEWTRPDGVREVVPAGAWRVRADGSERRAGLRADYFRGVDLREPWFSRDEPAIDHDFGSTGPRRDVPAATASSTLQVTLPPGTWAGSWIDPETGQTDRHPDPAARRRRGAADAAGVEGRPGPRSAPRRHSMIRAELHAHTADDPSDRVPFTAQDLIVRAAALGYGAIAITLHDAAFDPAPLAAFARQHGVRLLPGVERTVQRAHVLLINFPAAAAMAVHRLEDIAALKAAHPARPGRGAAPVLPDSRRRWGGGASMPSRRSGTPSR